MARGKQIGDDRFLAGMHYPSDVLAGQNDGAKPDVEAHAEAVARRAIFERPREVGRGQRHQDAADVRAAGDQPGIAGGTRDGEVVMQRVAVLHRRRECGNLFFTQAHALREGLADMRRHDRRPAHHGMTFPS